MTIPAQFPPPLQPINGPRPPMPDAVRRAVTVMFVGAAVTVITTLVTSIQVSHQFSNEFSGTDAPAAFGNLAGGFGVAAGIFGGALDVGLWIWMAFANRGGNNWARVLSTIAFGYSVFSLVSTVALTNVMDKFIKSTETQNGVTMNVPTVSGVTIGASAIPVLIGLVAIILIWQKSAAPFYKWRPIYPMPTWGGPAGPPYGYPMPYPQGPVPYPQGGPVQYPQGPVQLGVQYQGQPPQAQTPLAPPGPPVPPADQAPPSPWDTQS